jgi:hypothetical protein
MVGAVPQLMQAPMQAFQAPMQAMQPLTSMMGMFANPGALGMGGAAPGVSAVSAVSAAPQAAGVGGGGASLGGGVPTTFTRPVSAFEPGSSGRPVGLRPSGALGAESVRSQTTSVAGGAPVGGMPVGAAGGQRGSHGKSEQPATVRVVDDRV